MSLQKVAAKRASGKGKAKCIWRIQLTLASEKRVTVYLGQISEKTAKTINRHVMHLAEAARHNTRIEPETQEWIRGADRKLIEKLHKIGLCDLFVNPTVAEFTEAYIDSKKLNSAEGTILSLSRARTNLVEFLGPDRRVSSITANDAMEFFDWLRTEAGCNENTTKGRFSKVRQMFNNAVARDIITKNPFMTGSHSVSVGAAKKSYIPTEWIYAAIEQATNDEWKLLLAFGRFVGCRMPSEIRDLKWTDVNWEHNTILLHSPKTKRRGKPSRIVPIFREIQSYLLAQSEAVDEGEVYVFPRIRHHSNAATTAGKFVTAAGLKKWPKFWNSMRASRETDLMDEVGLRRACQWIGNSPRVAIANYALIKSTDYLDAGEKVVAESVALQDATGDYNAIPTHENAGKPSICLPKVAEAGLETIEFSLGKNAVSLNCNADSDEIRYAIINVLQALSKAELLEFCQALSQATLAKGGVK